MDEDMETHPLPKRQQINRQSFCSREQLDVGDGSYKRTDTDGPVSMPHTVQLFIGAYYVSPSDHCFHSNGEHSTGIVELNRKRKLLQYELGNSGLPWPKHKVRDRSSSSGQGCLIPESSGKVNSLEELTDSRICDGLEQVESENDSNSFVGGYDNTMVFDVKGTSELLSMKPFQQDHPSTSSNSSNSSNSSVSKNTLYSLESRSIKEVNNGENTDLEVTLKPGYMAVDDQYPGLVSYSVDFSSEFGKNSIEHGDETTDDSMLYSNDVTPNAFILASGRWSVGQDARLGTRKPTIDQEFEQYFSMLML